MRYLSFIAVVVSFLSVATLRGDDGLFSEVAMESVFRTSATTTTAVATKNVSGRLERITGVSSLVTALTASGFKAQEANGRATFELDHASWRFPVSMGVQVDQDRIDCKMTLLVVDDLSQLKPQTLLGLLSSRDDRGTSFAYDPEAKTIQVRASLSNRSITISQLKADLAHMASLAEKHADVWSALKGKPDVDAPSAARSASGEAKPVGSLIGYWSASLASGEAFAMAITADSQFQLVHLKSGKSTVSKGKIARSGNQLNLVGDQDVTLACTVTQTTDDTFSLAIKDAKGNVAVTLDFKKAK